MSTDALKAALGHLEIDENPVSVRAKSRDFFWYSPVLKARMDHLVADFVVSPRSEAEVIEVLAAAHAHDVPVTVRGAGTGNYGQAMPLKGGIVMHMKNMTAVKAIHPGRVIAEPGILLRDLDAETRAHSGQELRMHPSTAGTATLGGFIGGGSGGVGSCTWGVLRDPGNILRLRVVTAEATPRVLEFTGEELHRVSHAYGTNGVITELEMPLAPAYDWVHIFVTHRDFNAVMRLADDLNYQDGILKKLLSVYEAPTAKAYFQRIAPHVDEADHLLGLMIAPHSMDGFLTVLARVPGAKLIFRSDQTEWDREPGPAYEYGWNHTTLRALKVDPAITYLQVAYGGEGAADRIAAIRAAFPGELIQHLESMRSDGLPGYAGLTLVKFTTEARLDEIIAQHEAMGCHVFNPHRYTLEEGGRQTTDATQLDFKRQADPKGILNPGKMISWDVPDWDYGRMYDYAGMKAAE
jgi:FAD/FMN-containing dehydrogenase